jgi:2-isopropylmalate synthase
MPKYRPFPRVDLPSRQWPQRVIDRAPIWCSVDLRDGNQALATPMSVDEKLEMFELLLKIGFKEIEVGFPSASQIEFDFIRRLIDEKRIPGDVWIQVLTQAREHLIKRTVESVVGANKVILHLYNSTSPLQRKITFRMSREEIKAIAVNGARLVKSQLPKLAGSSVRFEYSPESFSDTEPEYALEVCEAVMDVWQPTADDPVVLNLPATVEWCTPNVHADQIEWFCGNMKDRDKAIVSLHTHNDRGTGVAATELGLLAGAQRVEGTLFGNGERTGNLDIVTVALNMFSQGIATGLDFHDLPSVRQVYERCTRMDVPPRHPYAGDLVFTAFSGSHQDAIKKGMDSRADLDAVTAPWEVPYLLIDPRDVGRTYEAIVRINSQSGKGGVAYVLSRDFGFELPKAMQPEMGDIINHVADSLGRELSPREILDAFRREFLDGAEPLQILGTSFGAANGGGHDVSCKARVRFQGREVEISGSGNGPIDSFAHAMEAAGWKDFKLTDFHEHAVGTGTATEAAAYIQIERRDGRRFFGAGMDTNINLAGLKALVSAYNRAHK